MDILFGELKRLAGQIDSGPRIEVALERPSFDFCRLSTLNVRFGVTWHLAWGNTLEDSAITFILTEGGQFYGGYTMKEPDYKEMLSYSVDLDRGGTIGWRDSKREKRFLTSAQLAEKWLKRLLERVHGRANRKP